MFFQKKFLGLKLSQFVGESKRKKSDEVNWENFESVINLIIGILSLIVGILAWLYPIDNNDNTFVNNIYNTAITIEIGSPSTPTATSTSTDTPTATFSPTATATLTVTSTSTDTPTATFSPTATATLTSTLTDTPTVTFSPTATTTLTSTSTNTPTVTATPTTTPSYTPVIPSPTLTLTQIPTPILTPCSELGVDSRAQIWRENDIAIDTCLVSANAFATFVSNDAVLNDTKLWEEAINTTDNGTPHFDVIKDNIWVSYPTPEVTNRYVPYRSLALEWYLAMAYCRWRGATRLPFESELNDIAEIDEIASLSERYTNIWEWISPVNEIRDGQYQRYLAGEVEGEQFHALRNIAIGFRCVLEATE